MNGLRRFILWDYTRASWQYDVMVALILAFIFLIPRDFFKDQPKASSVVLLPTGHMSDTYWIDSEVLNGVPEPDRKARAAALLKSRTGRKQNVVRVEPIIDAEAELKGYIAYTTP